MKPDPLRWELDPPCSEAEWSYLADLVQAPEFMSGQTCGYMNNICRRCFSARLDVVVRVRTRIRSRGGIDQCGPTERMRREYDSAHASDVVRNRPARIHGLQSAAAAVLNGQYCKLLTKEDERWTVELISGEQKAVKESNLEVSYEVDQEYEFAKGKHLLDQLKSGAKLSTSALDESKRPLGEKTAWPKVKGIHPGAVVKLRDLAGAAELNGRTGRCISFDQDSGRWKVDLGDGYKSLKVDNLVPAPGEKPPTKASAEKERQAIDGKSTRTATLTAKEAFAESYGWDG